MLLYSHIQFVKGMIVFVAKISSMSFLCSIGNISHSCNLQVPPIFIGFCNHNQLFSIVLLIYSTNAASLSVTLYSLYTNSKPPYKSSFVNLSYIIS
jgi:hypothetical protein